MSEMMEQVADALRNESDGGKTYTCGADPNCRCELP